MLGNCVTLVHNYRYYIKTIFLLKSGSNFLKRLLLIINLNPHRSRRDISRPVSARAPDYQRLQISLLASRTHKSGHLGPLKVFEEGSTIFVKL